VNVVLVWFCRHFIYWLLLVLLCGRHPVVFAQPAAETQPMPEWAKTLQYRAPDGHRYYVGVFSDASTREEALERSWLNTLISIARVEFPFLQTIKQFSVETLSGSEYRREAALAIERVRFDGVAEAQEKGSPYIVAKVVSGKEVFTAYRLLKWQEAKISSEVTRLKAEEKAPQLPNTTYENQIGDAGKATGQLTIQTKPAGAQILLDGDPLGRSNASFPKVSEGVYKLILQAEGYEIFQKQITISAAKNHAETITLKKLQGVAIITSEPSGALVFLDNVPQGRTPIEVKKEFGAGSIRVELEDFFSDTREISFNHLPSKQNFELRQKDGKLTVLSTPSGASVLVDGREIGKTPLTGKLIPGGARYISLKMDQFESWSQTVNIRASKTALLTPALSAIPLRASTNMNLAEPKDNPFRKMAPIGKWVAGGVSALSWMLANSAQSSADEAFSEYQKAKTAADATSARERASKYDSSASSRKTFSALAAFVCVGFVILDWDSNPDEAAGCLARDKNGVCISVNSRLDDGNLSLGRIALTFTYRGK
jgi:hypothetical protein